MLRHIVFAVTLTSAMLATTPAEASASKPPCIVGSTYVDAGKKLIRLGYSPVTMTRHPEQLCVDRRCTVTKNVTEGFCASDVPSCVFFWRGKSGRYLRVDTQGEGRIKVASVAWANRNDVRGQRAD